MDAITKAIQGRRERMKWYRFFKLNNEVQNRLIRRAIIDVFEQIKKRMYEELHEWDDNQGSEYKECQKILNIIGEIRKECLNEIDN